MQLHNLSCSPPPIHTPAILHLCLISESQYPVASSAAQEPVERPKGLFLVTVLQESLCWVLVEVLIFISVVHNREGGGGLSFLFSLFWFITFLLRLFLLLPSHLSSQSGCSVYCLLWAEICTSPCCADYARGFDGEMGFFVVCPRAWIIILHPGEPAPSNSCLSGL